MRALVLASLALGLAIAGSAAAGPLPGLPQLPPLPEVPAPELPVPEPPALRAGCVGAQVQAGAAGFSVDAPGCFVNDVAAPDPDPVGAAFPALPEVPLPEPPALPGLPLPP